MPASSARGQRPPLNIWPGYVDALATLLLVIVFVLTLFVISYTFVSSQLSGKERLLDRLNVQIQELADILSLERSEKLRLQDSVHDLTEELRTSLVQSERLRTELQDTGEKENQAQISLEQLRRINLEQEEELTSLNRTVEVDREKIEAQLLDLAILRSLQEELQARLRAEDKTRKQLTQEAEHHKTLSQESLARIELMNRQLLSLREQLLRLSGLLGLEDLASLAQDVDFDDLGTQLNLALTREIKRIEQYRSEFFGRLRSIFKDNEEIKVVGDRFVMQSELLFASGAVEIGARGRLELSHLARTLKELSRQIPEDIDWVLRVDGHTDRVPIFTYQFPSNWELSTARALSVVRFLINQGIAPERLAAAGFAEFRPIDPAHSPQAYARNRRIELRFDQR